VNLDPSLGSFISGGIEDLVLRLYDDAFAVSEERVIEVVSDPVRVAYGEDCSAALCQRPLRCVDLTCEASVLGQDYCDPANVTVSGLPGAPGTYTSTSVEFRILSGRSGFVEPSCTTPGSAEGREAVVSLEVPAGGRFDLVADTNNAVTDDTDTLIHLREQCIDPRTEVPGACNDDIDASTDASRIEVLDVAAGTYFLVVERRTFSATVRSKDVRVKLELRPVVSQGEACDPSGVQSRCATGSCQGEAPNATCQP